MIHCNGYGLEDPKESLQPFSFKRREPLEGDVVIEIQYCGVCHSDIHQARNEWSQSIYPMVPGHEIVGIVKALGSKVQRFQVGDQVGVGCMVDACLNCSSCHESLEQYCEKGSVATYNSKGYDQEINFGGYSDVIVVREEFVLKIPRNLDPAKAAPLLCAGITTYSPIQHFKMEAGDHVGVVGLGGLGHMAVKIARAKGCKVTVLTTSEKKINDAKRLGASQVINTTQADQLEKLHGQLDFIIDTVAAPHNLINYSKCLRRDGHLVLVGLPDQPHESLDASDLIFNRKSISGSLIGGIKETQEMLDFCAQHHIESEIEMIDIQQINQAYERAIKGDVKYRFVIDMKSLPKH